MLALGVLALACSRFVPWRDEPVNAEVNLAFTLEQNLIQLQSVRIDNREGRFLLGTAAPRTIVDPSFPLHRFRAHVLQIGQRETVRIDPEPDGRPPREASRPCSMAGSSASKPGATTPSASTTAPAW